MILHKVGQYYTQKIIEKGPVPQGVDWNSAESQQVRFEQLLSICARDESFSLLDYGCGYGALLDHMKQAGLCAHYTGYDISRTMIHHARRLHEDGGEGLFTHEETSLGAYDYVAASGIFNVCLDTPKEVWKAYVLETVDKMARRGRKGFAFNILTSYSDPEYRREDLFYADPCFFFDYCKTHYSKWVSLLHDYRLYEFTILVRKQENESWLT